MPSAALPQEVRPHMPLSSQIQWACYKKWKVEWEAQTGMSMVDIHLQKLLHVYCPGQAGVKGSNWADRLVGKATIASGLSQKIWNAGELWAWAQRHGHHTISCMEKRGMERGSHRQSALKGWERVTRIKPFQRQHWGIFWEMEWKAYWLFQVHRHHLKLNWTISTTVKLSMPEA